MRNRTATSLVLVVWALLSTVGCGTPSSNGRDANGLRTYLPETGKVSPTDHPLVARYDLTVLSAAQVSVEFGPSTSYGRTTGRQPAPSGGGTVSVLVAGMHANTTYHMRARADFIDGTTVFDSDHSFTVGPLPQITFPSVSVTPPGNAASGGVSVISSFGADVSALVLDTDGSVIWYYYDPNMPVGSFAFPLRLADNGNFLINFGNEVREVDLEGHIARRITVDQLNSALAAAGYSLQVSSVHHDLIRFNNGHWLLLVDENKDFQDLPGYPGTTTVLGDAVVELDASNQPVWVWRAFDHLDINRHPFMFPDWTHGNTLVRTPDGNLLISMRHQSWVIKVNYADGAGTGDVIWRLGPGGDFTLSDSDPAQWFYNQHDPVLLPASNSNTRLILFDNGNIRPDSNGQPCGDSDSCYSRGVILDFDDSKLTADIEWQYKLGWFAFWGGSVEVLPNGDVEIGSSTVNNGPARVLEVTGGTAPQVVWELDSSDSFFYRAYRVPSLYPGVSW